MPSNKNSLSEEKIFADIMEMISNNSNKKSKNVKSSSKNNSNKKTKNVKNSNSKKNSKKNSKRNLRGGFSPLPGNEMMDMSRLASIEQQMPSLNNPSKAMGINVDSQGVQSDMGNSGGMAGGMKKRRVKKSGAKKVKKVVKKSGAKKSGAKKVKKVKKVVKKSGAKKVKKAKKVVKKSGAKKVKKVVKKSGAKKVKRVVKKAKRVAKK